MRRFGDSSGDETRVKRSHDAHAHLGPMQEPGSSQDNNGGGGTHGGTRRVPSLNSAQTANLLERAGAAQQQGPDAPPTPTTPPKPGLLGPARAPAGAALPGGHASKRPKLAESADPDERALFLMNVQVLVVELLQAKQEVQKLQRENEQWREECLKMQNYWQALTKAIGPDTARVLDSTLPALAKLPATTAATATAKATTTAAAGGATDVPLLSAVKIEKPADPPKPSTSGGPAPDPPKQQEQQQPAGGEAAAAALAAAILGDLGHSGLLGQAQALAQAHQQQQQQQQQSQNQNQAVLLQAALQALAQQQQGKEAAAVGLGPATPGVLAAVPRQQGGSPLSLPSSPDTPSPALAVATSPVGGGGGPFAALQQATTATPPQAQPQSQQEQILASQLSNPSIAALLQSIQQQQQQQHGSALVKPSVVRPESSSLAYHPILGGAAQPLTLPGLVVNPATPGARPAYLLGQQRRSGGGGGGDLLATTSANARAHALPSLAIGPKGPSEKKERRRNRGVNLPRKAVRRLKEFLLDHFDNPYPSEAQKGRLAKELDLEVVQVNTWFINARMRLWKPVVESVFASMKDRLEFNLQACKQRAEAAAKAEAEGEGEGNVGGNVEGEGSEEVAALLEKYHRVQEAEDPRAKVAFMMTDPWSEQKLQETKMDMIQNLRRESETQRLWSTQAEMQP